MIKKTSRIPGEPAGWKVLLLFAAGTMLLYFPVLSNGFVTDDYASLYRLLIEKRVIFREILRPLIDLSFYLNYLVSGLHPLGYYLFNFIVHTLACYLVYRVALRLPFFGARRQVGFALTAGVLFLFYPFHNEGVIWLSGRLSSMAAVFALLAIEISLRKARPWNFWLAAMCWWIGLFAYESIVVLPALILLFEWMKYRDVSRLIRGGVSWMAAGIAWIGLRILVQGNLFSEYGNRGMTVDKGDNPAVRFGKVLGRCFLPPLENARWMIGLFVVVILAVVVLHFVFRLRRKEGQRGWSYLGLEAGFLLSLLPAFVFGVSTRTSEGDRLLYFPSCFLCILISAGLFFFVSTRRWRMTICVILAAVSIVFIEGNNRKWAIASQIQRAVMDTVRAAPGRVVLVNAPDEWEGAFIFRNNFYPALVVNGIDTNKVMVTHFLTRKEFLPMPGGIEPERKDDGWWIYPATRIGRIGEGDRVYYWNGFVLKRLHLDP